MRLLPCFSGKINRFSAIEPVVEATMVRPRKCDHELTRVLRGNREHKTRHETTWLYDETNVSI